MNARRAIVAGVVLVVLLAAAALVAWRRSPAKLEEHTTTAAATSTSSTSSSSSSSTVATATHEETHRAPVVRERLDPRTGAVVERVTVGEVVERRETDTAAAAATHGEAHVDEHTETRTEVVRVVEAARAPRLSLAIAAPFARYAPGAGLELASPASSPRLELEVRPFTLPLLERLELRATYSPPLFNPQRQHVFSGELRFVLLEW